MLRNQTALLFEGAVWFQLRDGFEPLANQNSMGEKRLGFCYPCTHSCVGVSRMHEAGDEKVASVSTIREKLWVGLATFGGSGLFPVAPGTAGSLASFIIWAPVVLLETLWWQRAILVCLVFLVGIPACTRASTYFKTDDPKQAVIDEVAGQGLTLLLAPAVPWQLIIGFLFFRLFDVLKPWPIRWIDRHIHGGLGVMLDDMLAGVFALVCMVALDQWFWGNIGMAWMTTE